MYRNLALAATAACFLLLAGTPALAQTASCGEFSGAAYGLCNAYCEAMSCGSDNQQASDNACMKVKDKFDVITSSAPLPCTATDNTAPKLDLNFADPGTLDATATFVSFGKAVPIAVNVEITDSDGGNTIISATVTLMNPIDPDETLSLSPAGHDLLAVLVGGNVADDGTTALLITGTGTLAQYAAILQQVVYDNAAGAPDTTLRTVDVTVSDGTAPPSNTAVAAVTVEHGCPCTSLSSGFFQNTHLWDFYKRIGTRAGFVWRLTLAPDPPSCTIQGDEHRFVGDLTFGAFDQTVNFGEVSVDFRFDAGAGTGGCSFGVRQLMHQSNPLQVLSDYTVQERRDTDQNAQNTDPLDGLAVFTDSQIAACTADIGAYRTFFREYYESRGAICTPP